MFEADQSKCSYLSRVRGSIGNASLDIVIDDGSHVPEHVIRTLGVFFPLLRDGGYHVVEDIETSYWDKPQAKVYGYPLPNVGIGRAGSVIEAFKWLR